MSLVYNGPRREWHTVHKAAGGAKTKWFNPCCVVPSITSSTSIRNKLYFLGNCWISLKLGGVKTQTQLTYTVYTLWVLNVFVKIASSLSISFSLSFTPSLFRPLCLTLFSLPFNCSLLSPPLSLSLSIFSLVFFSLSLSLSLDLLMIYSLSLLSLSLSPPLSLSHLSLSLSSQYSFYLSVYLSIRLYLCCVIFYI